MAVSFIESPKKKKITKAIMDNAVQKFIEDTSFSIPIESKDGKATEVTFKSQVNGMLMKMYFDLVKSTSFVQQDGMLVIDLAMLGITTNTFMIEYLSTLPLPSLSTEDNSGGVQPDLERIAAYGIYFAVISEEYAMLYGRLMDEALKVCEMYIDQYQILAEISAQNTDVSKLMSDPQMLEILKSTLTGLAGGR